MSRINARSKLISMIDEGDHPLGSFVMSTDAAITALIASTGFDFVVVDCEHAPNDLQSTLGHIRAAEANGCTPMVRVLQNNPTLIQSMLDVGAQGIIVPKIGTASDAEAALQATRYGPGGRGMCNWVEGARWTDDLGWVEHRESSNHEILFIPLIETTAGIDNLAEIAAIDGVDFVFFGAGDLSVDMGLDMDRDGERLVEIWNDAVEVVHAAGGYIGSLLGVGFEGGDWGLVSDLPWIKAGATRALAKYRTSTSRARLLVPLAEVDRRPA